MPEFLRLSFEISPELMVLTLVILFEWILPLPYKYSPGRACRVLADAFIRKVATKGDSQQQQLAGWLSLVTYLFLILVIVAALLFAMIDDVWTQGILLYLALGYQSVAKDAKQIAKSLTHGQKQMARSLLQPHSQFQTAKSTNLGMTKLTLESVTLHFVSYWLMPIVLFLVFNGLTALVYRMIIEAYVSWLPLKKDTQYFGRAVFKLKNWLDLLPTLLFAPIYSVFKSSPGWLKLTNQNKQKWLHVYPSLDTQLYWLAIVAAGCKTELAGPVMVNDEKVRRPRFNKGADTSEQVIKQLLNWNNRFRLFVLLFLTLITLVLYGVKT